jgi:hypothetical protein
LTSAHHVIKHQVMRTTLTRDEDVYRAAKALALARSTSIGAVISDLVRKAMETRVPTATRGDFPVFTVRSGARPITLEDVQRAQEDE